MSRSSVGNTKTSSRITVSYLAIQGNDRTSRTDRGLYCIMGRYPRRRKSMNYGVAIFLTDYSIGPAEIGIALEERGFESLWAPEHSHIPLSRRSPFPQGGDLPKKYYDVMDPFVTLAAASAAT